METHRFKKQVVVALMACLMPIAAAAQSGSQLYNQGVALFNKGNYQEAITLFQKSMAIDGSANNKQKCNAMISKCKSAKSKTSTPRSTTVRTYSDEGRMADYSKVTEVEAVQDKKRLDSKVLPDIFDSNFEVKKKGEYPWLYLSKADGKVIIRCDDNTGGTRWATYTVIHNGKSTEYQVEQKGVADPSIKSGDDPVIKPAPRQYSATVQSKQDFLLLTGLGSGTPKIKKCSPWIIPLNYKYKKPGFFQKIWQKLFKKKGKIAPLEPGEAAFEIELFTGDEPTREGFIEIEGVGRYTIIQAASGQKKNKKKSE